MSGETKLFNIPANTLRPGPTLTIVQGSDGKTTATMDFTCRKFDIGKPLIQSKLVKGTSLVTLYPQAGTEFNFLQLNGYTARDEPGGITTVTCDFSGVDTSGDGGGTDNSVVYTRNNSLRELPIWQNPKLIEELSHVEIDAIKQVVNGTAYLDRDTDEIKRIGSDALIESLTSQYALEWYEYIVTKGNETYLAATSEWTKSATGTGGLSSATLADFGKIDTPPGSPAAPTGQEWLFTGATESIQVTGDGVNSYSLTWTSGEWPARIYS